MQNKTTDTILYGVFALLVVAGAGLLYKFYTLKQTAQEEIAPIALPTIQKNQKKKVVEKPTTTVAPPLELKNVKKTKLKPRKYEPPQITHERKVKTQTKVTQRRFQKSAKIRVDWPEGLEYFEADIEDGVKSIYGYNNLTGEELTAFARPSATSIDEIKQYIQSNADAIPNLKGQKITNLSAPKIIPNSGRKSGVENVQVMSAGLGKDKSVHFALINRKDKEGSYVFVFSAPKGSIEGNDGYVEQIYKTMRVLPNKK